MYVSLSEIQIKEEEDAMNRPFTKVTRLLLLLNDVGHCRACAIHDNQRERLQKMAVHVRYKSLYIS